MGRSTVSNLYLRGQMWVKTDLDQIIISAHKRTSLWPSHEIQYMQEVEGRRKKKPQRNPGDWRFVNAKLWLRRLVCAVLVKCQWECCPIEMRRLLEISCCVGEAMITKTAVLLKGLRTSKVKYHFTKKTNKSSAWARMTPSLTSQTMALLWNKTLFNRHFSEHHGVSHLHPLVGCHYSSEICSSLSVHRASASPTMSLGIWSVKGGIWLIIAYSANSIPRLTIMTERLTPLHPSWMAYNVWKPPSVL